MDKAYYNLTSFIRTNENIKNDFLTKYTDYIYEKSELRTIEQDGKNRLEQINQEFRNSDIDEIERRSS